MIPTNKNNLGHTYLLILLITLFGNRSRLCELRLEVGNAVVLHVRLILQHLANSFALIGRLVSLLELGRRQAEAFFALLQVILDQLNATVEGGHFGFELCVGGEGEDGN